MAGEKTVKLHNRSDKPDNIVLREHEIVHKCEEIQKELPNFMRGFFAYLKGNVLSKTRLAYLTDIRFFCQYLISETGLTEADTIQNNEVNTKVSANDNASFDSNGNDSNPNSYPTVKQSSQSNQGEQIKSGSVLPNTSTNYFNMLVIGFVFMVVGGVFYLYFRKKAIN